MASKAGSGKRLVRKRPVAPMGDVHPIDPSLVRIVTFREGVEAHLRRYTSKGRKLRKPAERPHPELKPDAPANRIKKQVALTLPPELVSVLNEQCEALGVDRNSFIEFAIRAALKQS